MTDDEQNFLMLEELLAVEEGLTAWEMDFLDSLNGQAEHSKQRLFLTEKQYDCLDRIWNKVLG